MLIGVLADTHVPYRMPEIPGPVVEALRGVDFILHAGDVDEPWALAPLQALAPVLAVRGNYHILDRSAAGATLPRVVELDFAGRHLAMEHGFDIGPLAWVWKARSLLRQLSGHWDFPQYDAAIARCLLRRYPTADVIIFGHTHRYYCQWWGEKLVLNPGAALHTSYLRAPYTPSVVYLQLLPDSPPQAKRLRLPLQKTRPGT